MAKSLKELIKEGFYLFDSDIRMEIKKDEIYFHRNKSGSQEEYHVQKGEVRLGFDKEGKLRVSYGLISAKSHEESADHYSNIRWNQIREMAQRSRDSERDRYR
tara:strand:+ start:2373 stop:2681 length:309 start_codon:yes stop_codon:yes gene_type:complete